jgi:hypothetical protein
VLIGGAADLLSGGVVVPFIAVSLAPGQDAVLGPVPPGYFDVVIAASATEDAGNLVALMVQTPLFTVLVSAGVANTFLDGRELLMPQGYIFGATIVGGIAPVGLITFKGYLLRFALRGRAAPRQA